MTLLPYLLCAMTKNYLEGFQVDEDVYPTQDELKFAGYQLQVLNAYAYTLEQFILQLTQRIDQLERRVSELEQDVTK